MRRKMVRKMFDDFVTRKMSRKSFCISIGIFFIGGICVYFFDFFNPSVEQGFGSGAYGSGFYGG